MSISNHWLLRKNHGWHRNSHNFESGVAKNVDFISMFLHQINKNRLEINNFGGAHGKNLDLRVHTVGAHGGAVEINRFSRVHPEINKNCSNQ